MFDPPTVVFSNSAGVTKRRQQLQGCCFAHSMRCCCLNSVRTLATTAANCDLVLAPSSADLLRSLPPPCANCALDMSEIRTRRPTGDGLIWWCPRHKACKQGMRQDSFFEQSRLGLKFLLCFSVCGHWRCLSSSQPF